MSEHQPTTTVQKTELENGVRVLSERVPGVRSVSVGALVDVGPKNETAGECGYAHLVEHMLFQGTGERDAGAIAEMMEIGGGGMGAFTARDYTVYHATVLDEYLPFALEVLGDMLCNSVLPAEALERQRAVILNEISGQSDPLEQSNLLMKSALWPEHPLGFPTAGLALTIQSASRDALVKFMQRHYVGKNLVLAAAGNIDHALFADQARDSFWSMSDAAAAGPAPVPPKHHLGTVVAEPRDCGHVYFSMAWPAPAYTDAERYAWHVFATLFGGGPNARLYRELRETQGLVYHIAAEYQAYGSTG
ncbi:MAG: insulinase family protein, partial [Chloroflexi bacterium]|nr:insulinase family protein [Chloroflexota bacterium]